MSKIIIGTSNPGKVREVGSILSPLGYSIEPKAMDIDETGKTIEDNAELKARAYSEANPDIYVIAEDSGLVVPNLNNLPGPYSARFHEITLDDELNVINVPKETFTTDKTEHDKLNNERLINVIKNIPENKRAAYFEVCFCIALNGICVYKCTERAYGFITDKPAGENGFGYDPIFIGNDTFGKTYAELDSGRKNLRSHRKKALNRLGLWISQNIQ